MSSRLHALNGVIKGDYIGTTIGVIKGDTTSLDDGSCTYIQIHGSFHFMFHVVSHFICIYWDDIPKPYIIPTLSLHTPCTALFTSMYNPYPQKD